MFAVKYPSMFENSVVLRSVFFLFGISYFTNIQCHAHKITVFRKSIVRRNHTVVVVWLNVMACLYTLVLKIYCKKHCFNQKYVIIRKQN